MAIRDVLLKVRLQSPAVARGARNIASSLERASESAGGLGSKMALVRSRLSGVVSGFINLRTIIGAIVAGAAVKGFIGFVKSIGEIQGVEESFGRLTAAQNESADVMFTRVNKALDGTVGRLELMRAVNQAILLGLPAAADKMAKLADAAQRLGRAVGRGPVESFQDLVTGIGRQSRLILDNLGLVVKVGEANTEYAKKLGKSTDALSAQEQKMAFYEATMAAVDAKLQDLGEEHLNMGDKTAQLTAEWDNLVIKMKKSIASGGMLEKVFGRLKRMLPAVFNLGTKALQGFISMLPSLLSGLGWVVDNAETLIKVFTTIQGMRAGAQIGGAFGGIGGAIGVAAGGLLGLGAGAAITGGFGKAAPPPKLQPVANINTSFNVSGQTAQQVERSIDEGKREVVRRLEAPIDDMRQTMTNRENYGRTIV